MPHYVSIAYKDRFVNVHYIVDGPSQILCTAGHGAGLDSIFERTELGDNKVTFRLPSHDPHEWQGAGPDVWGYISADPTMRLSDDVEDWGGAVRINWLEAPGDNEVFTEVWLPNDGIALKTSGGYFVTASNDGDGSPLAINRLELGPWETFNYAVPPDELLPKEHSPADGAVDRPTTYKRIPEVEGVAHTGSPLHVGRAGQEPELHLPTQVEGNNPEPEVQLPTNVEQPEQGGLRDKLFRRLR